jgi:hypothetical protein
MAAAVAAVVGSVAVGLPTQASSGSSSFSVVKLLGGNGGEPSITTDRLGNVYVSAPKGIPAGVGGSSGGQVWISHNGGNSFSSPKNLGSYSGGGDSDIQAVLFDPKTVYFTDLQAWSASVCMSQDSGATWGGVGPAPDPNGCSVASASNYGPSNDRQWLTTATSSQVYLNYHEFTSAQPVIVRSDNQGADGFTAGPCGPIISDPTIEANMLNDLTEGSLVSKPVVSELGRELYILITSSTQQQQAAAAQAGHASPTVSQAYFAVSKDQCKTFTDYTIFDGSAVGTNSVQFGDDFNVLARDGQGTLYAVSAGYIGSKSYPATTANIFMFVSQDDGKTWSKPRQLNLDKGAHMLPAVVAGEKRGELAVGYFRTANGTTDPNDTKGKWTYTIAESSNANSDNPAFQFTDMQNGFIYHKGDICNSGTLCGTGAPGTGSDRSLADFTSATLGQNDCPVFVWAGNPTGNSASTTFPYVARQTAGCFTGAADAASTAPSAAPTTAPTAAPAPLPPTSSGGSQLPGTTPGVLPALPITGFGFVGFTVAAFLRRARRR